jgi:hypothetical protein
MPELITFDTNTLIASVIWGGIGSGFLIYGWKQKSAVPLGTGVVMVGLSYFVGSALYMSLAEVATLVVMYWLKKQGY